MVPTFDPGSVTAFEYLGFEIDPAAGEITFSYALDSQRHFEEHLLVGPGHDWDHPGVGELVRLVYLLSGVSYYKIAAPPSIRLNTTVLRPGELEFLKAFYIEGLGEFAYRNELDLSGLSITAAVEEAPPARVETADHRPLIPFGGGIDSIVTVEAVRDRTSDAALCIVSPQGTRFAALEATAAITGLPVLRAQRVLDPILRRSAELGFRNGHVPVTGIISSIAVLLAALDGRSAVVMSNEWSASIGTEVGGRTINHQYSKGIAFEAGFREVLAGIFHPPIDYFSLLRSMSTLRIARRFAQLTRYHDTFRSCNRAFHIDPERRLDRWCGRCDKCCFVDLMLAPFMPAAALRAIFNGREPLENPELAGQFRTLLGRSSEPKPFECVGDIHESRAAAALAAQRQDRAGNPLLAEFAAQDDGFPNPADFLAEMGPGFVPESYAFDSSLV